MSTDCDLVPYNLVEVFLTISDFQFLKGLILIYFKISVQNLSHISGMKIRRYNEIFLIQKYYIFEIQAVKVK